MLCVVDFGLSGRLYHIFHIFSYTARFSKIKINEHKMCVLIFSITVSETFLILWRIQWCTVTNTRIHRPSCKVPAILVIFSWNANFHEIFETYSNMKFHESVSTGSRVYADGQTNMLELIVPFRKFVNAPKISAFFPRRLFMYFMYSYDVYLLFFMWYILNF
jgi:hypothetical protein